MFLLFLFFLFFFFQFITIPIIPFSFWVRPVRVKGHGRSQWILFAQGSVCCTIVWSLLSLVGYGYWWTRCSCGCGSIGGWGNDWLHEGKWSFNLSCLYWGSLRHGLCCLGWSWESLSNQIDRGVVSYLHLSWFGSHGPFLWWSGFMPLHKQWGFGPIRKDLLKGLAMACLCPTCCLIFFLRDRKGFTSDPYGLHFDIGWCGSFWRCVWPSVCEW